MRVLLAGVLVLAALLTASSACAVSGSVHRFLVVASDFEDVMWARMLAEKLGGSGYHVSVDVLYLSKDYPLAGEERAKLRDLGFLWRYEAVLLPDLNKPFTYGGVLEPEEVRALLLYAKAGHVVVVGLNTLIHNWYRSLEDAAGVEVVNVIENQSLLRLEAGSVNVLYNASFGLAVVRPLSAKVLYRFNNGYPAVTVNKYGRGFIIVMTFNAVKAVFEQPAGELYVSLSADLVMEYVSRTKPSPPPLGYRISTSLRRAGGRLLSLVDQASLMLGGGVVGYVLAVLLLAMLALLVLLLLSVTCILPRRLRIAVLSLLLARTGIARKRCQNVVNVLRKYGPLDSESIRHVTGLGRLRLCLMLSLCEARGVIGSVKLRDDGEHVVYVVSGNTGMVLSLGGIHRAIVRLVSEEPGVLVSEIAARLGAPIDVALAACKELAAIGVVEMRKVLDEYEVYPATLGARAICGGNGNGSLVACSRRGGLGSGREKS